MRATDLFGSMATGIAVPFWIAVAAVLITLDQFYFAEMCFAFAGIWFLGYLVFRPITARHLTNIKIFHFGV
jgi:hypothetical protein